MSAGNEELRKWLERDDTPSQHQLAGIVPRMHQPTISRHAAGSMPGLRTVLWYQLVAGIDPESWLSASERLELEEARREGVCSEVSKS